MGNLYYLTVLAVEIDVNPRYETKFISALQRWLRNRQERQIVHNYYIMKVHPHGKVVIRGKRR